MRHLLLGIAGLIIAPVAHGQLVFEEVSTTAGIDATYVPGPNHIVGLAHMVAGGATGDFDADGWQDLYVITGGAAPDKLYMNQGDGTFVDEAAAWGLTDSHMGSGVAVGDFNGDGWLDLFVTSHGDASGSITNGAHRLYRNGGNGTFVNIAATAGVDTNDTVPNAFGAAFGDYDLDGDLDLFVTGWVTNGIGGNRLYRNNGDETFTDVTAAAGVLDLDVHGFSPRFADTDGDRYPELLLAADFETSRYYVNNGDGTFTDESAASGTTLDCNGMGATIGDFDNDGLIDWYVTNIYSESTPEDPCGNMLYVNKGEHTFLESAAVAGVIHGWWGWGTVAADFDLNGWTDIAEVNGFRDGSLNQVWADRPSRMWLNQTDNTFAEQASACSFDHTGQGRGLVNFDYDNDGDQDLVVFSSSAPLETTVPVRLYRNDQTSGRTWLRVLLDTQVNPDLAPHGFGTRVEMTTGTATQIRLIDGGSNYLSQSELSAHFGLATASIVDELRVLWNDGQVTTLTNVAVDQTIIVTSPPKIGDLDASGEVGFTDLVLLLASWGPCVDCPADLDGSGDVTFSDLVTLLNLWD